MWNWNVIFLKNPFFVTFFENSKKKNLLYHKKRIANIKMKLDFYENDVKIEKNETNPLTFWRRRVAFFSRVYQLNIFVIHPSFLLFQPFFSKFRAKNRKKFLKKIRQKNIFLEQNRRKFGKIIEKQKYFQKQKIMFFK